MYDIIVNNKKIDWEYNIEDAIRKAKDQSKYAKVKIIDSEDLRLIWERRPEK